MRNHTKNEQSRRSYSSTAVIRRCKWYGWVRAWTMSRMSVHNRANSTGGRRHRRTTCLNLSCTHPLRRAQHRFAIRRSISAVSCDEEEKRREISENCEAKAVCVRHSVSAKVGAPTKLLSYTVMQRDGGYT